MAISFSINRPSDFEGSPVPSLLIGAFVAMGGILYGYDTGTMGGILVMPYWRDLFSTGYINPDDNKPDVTTSQTSLVVSILSVGTFFGALLAAPLADKVGRRWGMLLSASIVFNLGIILQTIATALPMFVAGRVFAGLGVGLISAMGE